MQAVFLHWGRRAAGNVLLAAVTFGLAAAAHSQATAADSGSPIGRIDFTVAKLPEANVEVDVSQEMFRDLFGIGDAAIAGVAETLMKATGDSDTAKSTKLAAEQLEAARQIVQLAGNVVREVRVRVYEDMPKDSESPAKLFGQFDEQLKSAHWETLVKVHDGENVVRVSAIRHEGALKGIFVNVTDGDSLVLANVVCDISPENVKKLTSTATKVGLDNGLAQQIAMKMKHMPGKMNGSGTIVIKSGEQLLVTPAAPPTPPAPPAPPKAAAPPAEAEHGE